MIKRLKHIDEILKLYPSAEVGSDNEYNEYYITVITANGIRFTINQEMRKMMIDRAVIDVEPCVYNFPKMGDYNYDYVMSHFQHDSTSCWAFCKEWFYGEVDIGDDLFDIK